MNYIQLKGADLINKFSKAGSFQQFSIPTGKVLILGYGEDLTEVDKIERMDYITNDNGNRTKVRVPVVYLEAGKEKIRVALPTLANRVAIISGENLKNAAHKQGRCVDSFKATLGDFLKAKGKDITEFKSIECIGMEVTSNLAKNMDNEKAAKAYNAIEEVSGKSYRELYADCAEFVPQVWFDDKKGATFTKVAAIKAI